MLGSTSVGRGPQPQPRFRDDLLRQLWSSDDDCVRSVHSGGVDRRDVLCSGEAIPWLKASLLWVLSGRYCCARLIICTVQDGVSPWAAVFFICLVLFGAVVIVNLFLAVISNVTSKGKYADSMAEEVEQARFNTSARVCVDLLVTVSSLTW